MNLEADFEFCKETMADKSTRYIGRRLKDNKVVAANASAETAYNATVACLPAAGDGTIIDRATGFTGRGVCLNRYFNREPYASEYLLPTRPENTPSQVVSCFDGGAGVEWTNFSPSFTGFTDDSTWCKYGTTSIKTTVDDTSNGAGMKKMWDSTPIDMTGKHFHLRIYIPDIQDIGAAGGREFMWVYIYTTDGTGTHLYTCSILGDQGIMMQYFGGDEVNGYGWCDIDIRFSMLSVGGGTPDWTKVTGIGWRLHNRETHTMVTWWDALEILPNKLDKGVVIIKVDDYPWGINGDGTGKPMTTMKPYMDKYGWKGVLVANGQSHDDVFYGGVGGANYDAELKALYDAGWDIASHSYEHNDMRAETDADNLRNIIKWFRWISSLGIKPVHYIQYPGGKFNYGMLQKFRPYFYFGMSVGGTFAVNQLQSWPPVNDMATTQVTCEDLSYAQVQGRIDTATTNKELCVLLWHSIRTANPIWTPTNFGLLMDYIATKDVYVMTPTELITKYPLGKV